MSRSLKKGPYISVKVLVMKLLSVRQLLQHLLMKQIRTLLKVEFL